LVDFVSLPVMVPFLVEEDEDVDFEEEGKRDEGLLGRILLSSRSYSALETWNI
jgi:hypothetical protein